MRSIFFAPKYCEMTTEAPMPMPVTRAVVIKTTGVLAPTAASASVPMDCPTIMVSTSWQSCINRFHNTIRSTKRNIWRHSEPCVKSFIFISRYFCLILQRS